MSEGCEREGMRRVVGKVESTFKRQGRIRSIGQPRDTGLDELVEFELRVRFPFELAKRTRFSSSGEVIVRPDQEKTGLFGDAGDERAGLITLCSPFVAGHDVGVDAPSEKSFSAL